jgi:hypothetical protein
VSKRLLLIALFLSLVLFTHTNAVEEPVTPPTTQVTPTPNPFRKVFVLKVVSCPEATVCIMNVVGETGLLGKQVSVLIGSYQAPSAHYYGCRLERWKGKKAAKYLEETLKTAEYVFLVNAHKNRGSSYLSGTLIVDGEDITVAMFRMQLAVPRGIKVDWCEKLSRRLEV